MIVTVWIKSKPDGRRLDRRQAIWHLPNRMRQFPPREGRQRGTFASAPQLPSPGTVMYLTTGQVAALLRQHSPKPTELRLAALVRAGRIPAPPITAGRRAWAPAHVAAAAEAFGIRVDLLLTPPSGTGANVAPGAP